MLKCIDCFLSYLPGGVSIPGRDGDSGYFKSISSAEDLANHEEERYIALAQSRDAVTVYQNMAVCVDHLISRYRNS
jgi:hypothetical protein